MKNWPGFSMAFSQISKQGRAPQIVLASRLRRFAPGVFAPKVYVVLICHMFNIGISVAMGGCCAASLNAFGERIH
jgi:hypothetical protein